MSDPETPAKKRLTRKHRATSMRIPQLDLGRALDTDSMVECAKVKIKSPTKSKPGSAIIGSRRKKAQFVPEPLSDMAPTPRTELKSFDDHRALLKMVFVVTLDANRTVHGCRISYANRERSEIYRYNSKGVPAAVVSYINATELYAALENRDLTTGNGIEEESKRSVLDGIVEGIPLVRFDPGMLPTKLRKGKELKIKTGALLMPLDEVYRAFLAECCIHPRQYLSSVIACLGMHLPAEIVGLYVLKTYTDVAEDFCKIRDGSGGHRELTPNPGCIYPERRCAYWRTRADYDRAIERITDQTERVLNRVSRTAKTLKTECRDVHTLVDEVKENTSVAIGISRTFEEYCTDLTRRNQEALEKYYMIQFKLDQFKLKYKDLKITCKDLEQQRDHAMHRLEWHVTEHRSCTNNHGNCIMSRPVSRRLSESYTQRLSFAQLLDDDSRTLPKEVAMTTARSDTLPRGGRRRSHHRPPVTSSRSTHLRLDEK